MAVFTQPHLRLSGNANSFHSGDSLYKYQVEYKDPGSMGRELEWDFTKLNILNENYQIKYFLPDKKDTTRLCGMEHRTRYYYRQQNDSLWATGFENYTTRIGYTTPELKMKFPFSYGDTLYSTFEGEGLYSNMLKLHVKGYTRVKADAEGMLKLPELAGKALRVHARRHYTEVKAGRDDPFSAAASDSVPDPARGDTLRMTLDTYSWYVKDIRYPEFESIKTTLHRQGQDTAVFHTSFYYTPEELPVKQPEDELPVIEQVFTEASMVPNPVVNDLQVNYKLTRRAVVWFSVHNNIGQPMRHTAQRTLDAGWHNETINMGSLQRGTYTVYVHVDEMVMSRVVVKK